jgi:hypothetical protein
VTSTQCFINRLDQFFIVEDLVGLLHPWFPPILGSLKKPSAICRCP